MAEQLESIDDMTRFLGDVRATRGNSQILMWRPWEASSDIYGLDIDLNGTMYACMFNEETAADRTGEGDINRPTKIRTVDEAITYLNNLRVKRGNIPAMVCFTEFHFTQPITTIVAKSNGSYPVVLTNETGAEVLRDQNST